MTTRLRCKGTRKDGKPCRAWAWPGGIGYCERHDPDMNERLCFYPVGDGPTTHECGYQALPRSPYCLAHTRRVLARNRDEAERYAAGEVILSQLIGLK